MTILVYPVTWDRGVRTVRTTAKDVRTLFFGGGGCLEAMGHFFHNTKVRIYLSDTELPTIFLHCITFKSR